MRSELHHLFTLPRMAAALLISGVLLTVLAVTALAGEEPPAPAAAPDETSTGTAAATESGTRESPTRGSTRAPLSASPAATEGETTPAPVEEENEGAIEAPDTTVVEAARVEVSADGRFSMPLSSWIRVTDRYGAPRGYGLVHGGIDLAVSGNVPVLAACSGVVTVATYSSTYGNYVVVDCGEGWATLYGHFSALTVAAGDTVTRGTGLGYSGSTGYSTGEHLHFEIHYQGVRVNPEHYLDFKIPPGTPLSDGPILFPRNPYSNEPSGGSGDGDDHGAEATPTEIPPTATPTVTNTPTPTATPTVTNTPTPTPTPSPRPPTPTPTPRPVLR